VIKSDATQAALAHAGWPLAGQEDETPECSLAYSACPTLLRLAACRPHHWGGHLAARAYDTGPDEEARMSSSTAPRPPIQGLHHVSVTVTDVTASVDWYQRILGLQRLPPPFPNYGSEDTGYALVLIDADAGFSIGLHHHDGNDGHPFDERRTGLDHIAMGVANRADLDAWATRLDSLGVPHEGVNDTNDPIPYSALVFRDPDNIQLEFFHLPS